MRPSRFLLFLLSLFSLPASAENAEVELCYNYGCLTRQRMTFDAQSLAAILATLKAAETAEDERQRLAKAVGRLYALAAEQSPIGADRGGNYADAGVPGRMDCIDHSTTTTRFLQLLEAHGGLKWHRVLEPARRLRFFVMQHFSARIATLPAANTETPAQHYVVDSWFVDNGEAAIVLPLEAWENGAGVEKQEHAPANRE
ncbi:MAG: hypothetical protein LBR88_07740 [Zoogloeaceae bacterium]|jgi:hypothetical protein|nr:hypothetical protein [Zoogloeaceae bacterium]